MPNGGSTFWGFFSCRTDEFNAVNKLDGKLVFGSTFFFSAKQLLKKIGEKNFTGAEDCFTN